MEYKKSKEISTFEDLFIWNCAIEFARSVYTVTEKSRIRSDFGLKSPIRAASVSISSNIAEGFERRSRKEYLNFLNIAKGSAGEVRSQLFLAHRIGYLEDEDFELLRENAKLLSGSIANHMKSISRATPTS